MRLINTDTYEEIIKEAQTNPLALYIDGDMDKIRCELETLAELKTEKQSGNVFIMDNDVRGEMVTDLRRVGCVSKYAGHKIISDSDMIPEKVLFINPDSVALSGRVLDAECIGVIDFSDTEPEARR